MITNLFVRFRKFIRGAYAEKNIHLLIKLEFDERKSFTKKRTAVLFIIYLNRFEIWKYEVNSKFRLWIVEMKGRIAIAIDDKNAMGRIVLDAKPSWWGLIVHGENRPWGESSNGRNVHGAKRSVALQSIQHTAVKSTSALYESNYIVHTIVITNCS